MTCAVASKALCLHDPPTLIWRPKLNDTRVIMRTKADGTKEIISMVSFMPSRSDDGLNVSCVVEHEGIAPVQETVLLTVLCKVFHLPSTCEDNYFDLSLIVTICVSVL